MEITLLGIFAIGYFVLAGTDIGTGMLLPVLGKDADERRLVISSFAPFFLGNEVWLVATAGLLAGLFTEAETTLLPGLYPVVVALLLGWITRDMGLWLRGRGASMRWQRLTDNAVTAGSWTIALSWGAMAGAVIPGLPFGGVTSSASAALGASVAAALFALHGAAFAALRLTDEPLAKAKNLAKLPIPITAVAIAVIPVVIASQLSLIANPDSAWLAITLAIVAPFLFAVQAWTWWLFRGRVTAPTYL